MIGNCTHNDEFRTNKDIVTKCKYLQEDECRNLTFCHFNFDEEPLTEHGMCTHKEEHRKDFDKVNKCTELTELSCNQYDFC